MTVKELIDELGGCPPDAKVIYPEYESVGDRGSFAGANEVKGVTNLTHDMSGPCVVLHDANCKFTKYGWMLE